MTTKKSAPKAVVTKTAQGSALPLGNIPTEETSAKPDDNGFSKMVVRTPEVDAKVAKLKALKSKIIDRMNTDFGKLMKKKQGGYCVECDILKKVELSAEAFDLILEARPPQKIIRAASMLSGPFFTCAEFPVPVEGKVQMYPIAQFDLREASHLIQQPLGDGLLQLWYEQESFTSCLRVIPRHLVNAESLTKFDLKKPKKYASVPVPLKWPSDPFGECVTQIVGYTALGIQSQATINEEFDYDGFSEELIGMLKLFAKESPVESRLHLFGSFDSYRYCSAQVGKACLFDIRGWDEVGDAQIFYHWDAANEVVFTFKDYFS